MEIIVESELFKIYVTGVLGSIIIVYLWILYMIRKWK